ncbi:MAG: plasma-membrane proton-efflux P-type ATPase [Candidatus Bathyarchaeota archaeon]|nr:plasma-membrane proton-efflux P-type ATPase [Candidatus Bathyarchaeota archaeon]
MNLSDKKEQSNESPHEEPAETLNPDLLKTGLSSTIAQEKLKQYGFNEVPEKKPSRILQFARKFWGLSAWMLEIIIVLSWFLQRYSDVYIVFGLLVLNAVLGFVEEQRASGAVESLKEKLHVNARVLRDGSWAVLPARELVPSDIVRIRPGDFVPADVKLVDGNLEVDQSALTGESMAVERKPGEIVYSGSIVKHGESNALVTATGVKTYFGRTTQLIQIAKPKLHIEAVTSNVVKWLLSVVSALIIIAIAFSLARGFSILDVLPIILVVLLSAIPVALPAMFTVTMALGSMELAKKGVIVTRLSAAEDAATMDVLCADKTGTITMNKLSLAKVIPQKGFTEQDVILTGFFASQEANQDPIDLAFISIVKEQKLNPANFSQKSFVPFDPKTRKTEAVVQVGNNEYKVMKGAVKTVAASCGYGSEATATLETQMQEYADKGYRTLAVAKSEVKGRLQLVGLAALYDAPRPDSKNLIHKLKELGISVKMLTGDALPIAKEISKGIDLGENVIRAADLKECNKEDAMEAQGEAEKSEVFAEVYPEDKYAIVKSLQMRKHVVGMTGDGVNDAPALRQAEVGIAVSNATDVAKGAASVVLVNEGLTNIVDLVQNGRVIYERIIAWIVSKIVRTFQVATFSVLSFILTGNYVVSAFAIIAYFFLTDFVKIALSTDKFSPSNKPDTWELKGAVKAAIVLGLLVIAESFALLYIVLKYFHVAVDNPLVFTLTFEILFYSAIFLIFNVRERGHFWNSMPSKTLLYAIILSLVVGTAIVTIGIPNLPAVSITQTLLIMGLSAVFSFVINDTAKFLLNTRAKITW